MLIRYADLVLLALALPVFVLAGLPLAGYAAIAVAWLIQLAILAAADRASVAALRTGQRNRALGIVGFTTLARLWVVTLAILLVGVLVDREDGLAAGVLAIALVTAHLGGLAFSKLMDPEAKA